MVRLVKRTHQQRLWEFEDQQWVDESMMGGEMILAMLLLLLFLLLIMMMMMMRWNDAGKLPREFETEIFDLDASHMMRFGDVIASVDN